MNKWEEELYKQYAGKRLDFCPKVTLAGLRLGQWAESGQAVLQRTGPLHLL